MQIDIVLDQVRRTARAVPVIPKQITGVFNFHGRPMIVLKIVGVQLKINLYLACSGTFELNWWHD